MAKRVMAMVARAMATKMLCNIEGGDDRGKSDGDEGGRRAMAMATTWCYVIGSTLVLI